MSSDDDDNVVGLFGQYIPQEPKADAEVKTTNADKVKFAKNILGVIGDLLEDGLIEEFIIISKNIDPEIPEPEPFYIHTHSILNSEHYEFIGLIETVKQELMSAKVLKDLEGIILEDE